MASVYKRHYVNGKGRRVECANWTADVKVGDGFKRLPGFIHRKATEELARKVERLFTPTPSEAQRATGTEGRHVAAYKHAESAGVSTGVPTGGNGALFGATACASVRNSFGSSDSGRVIENAGKTADSSGKTIGGGGIRTPGTVARTTVFKTVPFSRSGTPPLFCPKISAVDRPQAPSITYQRHPFAHQRRRS